MNNERCPSFDALSAVFSGNGDGDVRAHSQACLRCQNVLADLAAMKAAGQSMPCSEASEAEVARAQDALIDAARRSRRRPTPVMWPAAAVAAIAASLITFVVVGGSEVAAPSVSPSTQTDRAPVAASPAPRATVAADEQTRFEHFTRHSEGSQLDRDEVVRLTQGTVRLSVEKLRPTERFRVIAGDGEVEVRGTEFTVTADGDRLESVRVISGRVVVRVGGLERVLGANDRWRRGEATEAERAFADAWERMRGGDLPAAADGFATVLQHADGGELSEDARYWRAVALLRAQSADADAAMRSFLQHHAASDRADEVSVMFGRRLLDSDRRSEARPLLERAARSESAAVRDAAQAALQRLR